MDKQYLLDKPILSPNDVCELLDVSMNSLQILLKKEESFPRPRYLSPRIKRWIADEIIDWILSRAKCGLKYEPVVKRHRQKAPSQRVLMSAVEVRHFLGIDKFRLDELELTDETFPRRVRCGLFRTADVKAWASANRQ